MREMYVCYDHDVALTAILFGCQWLEDKDIAIDIENAASVISKRRGMKYEEVREQLEIAFKRVVKSILPLASKKEISEKRRAAGKNGLERRWNRNKQKDSGILILQSSRRKLNEFAVNTKHRRRTK